MASRLRTRLLRFFCWAGIVLLAGLLGAVWWGHGRLKASQPVLSGTVEIAGLSGPVEITRDVQGTPVLFGRTRADLALALGFLHAQERFFQMDLLRRHAAGELAALLGGSVLEADRQTRPHLLRQRAHRLVRGLDPAARALLAAYTRGVNAGLAGLGEKPFEYMVLRQDPVSWQEEDTFLVLFAMFLMLNDAQGDHERCLGVLYDTLPPPLAGFLDPPGSEWDAPLQGEAGSAPPVPGPEVTDLRQSPSRLAVPGQARLTRSEPEQALGSSNWAVAGWRTRHGRAVLANDMHLRLAVPNTWYRAVLRQPTPGNPAAGSVAGVTLPGAPVVVAGSNGRVAWGFTNSYGDWSDLVVVEPVAGDPGRYLTPDGPKPFLKSEEQLRIRGGAPETLEVTATIWGPVVGKDLRGRPLAVRWIAHDSEAVNLGLLNLEPVATVGQALDVANRTGIPPQNFVCADTGGHIGWTIIGRIPRRFGFDGQRPVSWADGRRGWHGFLDPAEAPRIVDPPSGLIWTANSRVVAGEALAKVGDGGYWLGARGRQIRDGLLALDKPGEAELLAVQLDDRALFLERWRRLLLELLTPARTAANEDRAAFRRLVETGWTGRASVDSVGYHLVREFRLALFRIVYGWLTAPCRKAAPEFDFEELHQWEDPLWRLATQKPGHLLDPAFPSWEAVLLGAVDDTVRKLTANGTALSECRWGRRNTARIRHPLSGAIPLIGRWLDMPSEELAGDTHMPRVQGPAFGASERLVVSPGLESEAYFHMPGGQSGHPLSPCFRAGHEDWVAGRSSPFLPGPARWRLRLVPAGAQ